MRKAESALRSSDIRRAPGSHNECVNIRDCGRNFVNVQQGYREVKTAALAPGQFEISSRMSRGSLPFDQFAASQSRAQ
jgi:hypothetical protein